MLHLIIDENNIEDKTDIEELFKVIQLKGTKLERKVIELIEHGTYNDSESFIDRFGYKLYNSELSTGCKAALCVINRPDTKINLIECGTNAIDIILSICNEGIVVIQDRGITIQDFSENSIDVQLDKFKFTTIDRLNYYIFNERPFQPDMKKEGISYV